MSRVPFAAALLATSLGATTVGLAQPAPDTHVPKRENPPAATWCATRGASRACAHGAIVSIDVAIVTALRPGSGHLRLLVEPSTAEVYIDGLYAGTAAAMGELSSRTRLRAGRHRVELRAPGYWSPVFDITVEHGRTTVWRSSLAAVESAR